MNQTNESWQQRRQRIVSPGVGHSLPVYIGKACNAELWDVEGRRYIDFASGIAVLNTGHNHPRVIAAVKAQLERFTHSCFQVTPYCNYIELAEKLDAITPFSEETQTLLLSTGSEAIENAIKIARVATGRRAVIAFRGAFHGRTSLCMALTGKVTPYKIGFGPLPGEIYHVPYPAQYIGVSEQQSLDALEAVFAADVAAKDVAAIIIEPVQGEGGFYSAPLGFMQRLRALCDEHGIVLIVDEIQSGFCRTGKTFAIEYYGIEPDIMTLAKSLAGGFPLSAVIGRRSLMCKSEPGGLGGTYAGSPVSVAAALAVIDLIEEEKLNERAQEQGRWVRNALEGLSEEHDCIGDIRGVGAMLAMELVEKRDSRRPLLGLTQALIKEAGRQGLVLLACGVRSNVIRFLIPLTASEEIVYEGLNILSSSLKIVQNACAEK